jgi:hypothetical protein
MGASAVGQTSPLTEEVSTDNPKRSAMVLALGSMGVHFTTRSATVLALGLPLSSYPHLPNDVLFCLFVRSFASTLPNCIAPGHSPVYVPTGADRCEQQVRWSSIRIAKRGQWSINGSHRRS